jgi:glutamate/tyrosine decarboxylase-like PLP-dependent enzyme
MEKEAVAQLAGMFGWTTFLGHLTSGGTMANLEALWVAGQLAPGKVVLASSQAHYTHGRISGVLGLPFEAVPVDRFGRMEMAALEARLEPGDVGCVVATLGTTATGSVDPLPEILALRQKYGFRVHTDAAYGGYFGLAANLGEGARAAFDRISAVDSLVIDPHKHGLQPYGCGCVLFRDPSVGRFYKHDSPYTYFSSTELHLGEISLECSRAGAAAVALWATQRLLPPVPSGEFAGMLAQCRSAALTLHTRLAADPRFRVGFAPELDIVVWAVPGGSARAVFEEAARRGLHLALAELPGAFFGLKDERISCLRSVQMKPEHADLLWQETLWNLLSEATDTVLGK